MAYFVSKIVVNLYVQLMFCFVIYIAIAPLETTSIPSEPLYYQHHSEAGSKNKQVLHKSKKILHKCEEMLDTVTIRIKGKLTYLIR